MKISINDIKFTPKNLKGYNVCVYGEPNEKLSEWLNYWKFPVNYHKPYTNIFINNGVDVPSLFEEPVLFDYIDGFSPNLNKHLHIGHMSNLVLAKAFQGLKIGHKFIAIFGDTLPGEVSKPHALDAYQFYCEKFKYKVDKSFFASEIKLKDFSLLSPGEGAYERTKVMDVFGEKVVAIKSDGSTTYFYQDVALAQHLQSSTLYLTGLEQDNHFNLLKKLYPNTSHLGLGLILFNGKKMSSSEGNVIFFKDVLEMLNPKFDNNQELIYNVLAGNILKSEPRSEKNINMDTIDNVKLSMGLYVSYTMARMYSAGIDLIPSKEYSSLELKLKSLKSKVNLKPHILFEGLVSACENINAKYPHYRIKDSVDNKNMFQQLTSDVVLAVNELGLLPITKV